MAQKQNNMNIKVCGITEMKQLQQLDGLAIDFAGMIFYKDSPRYIGDKLSKNDVKKADFDLKKTGVFVNPEMIDVLDAIDEYGLEVVQLHGDESPEMCEDLRNPPRNVPNRFGSCNIGVFPAIPFVG